MADINLTEKGAELGDFITEIGGPIGGLILAVGFAVAVVGVVFAVSDVVRNSVNSGFRRGR